MSDINKTDTHSGNSDEIDLRELFSAIGNFFKNIFLGFIMLIVYFRNATRRNLKMIALFAVLGGSTGIWLNYVLPDYYSTYMLINSKYSNGGLMENSVSKLQQLCEEKNYKQLALVLDIEPSKAKNLKGFSYERFISEEEILELEVLKEKLKSLIKEEDVVEMYLEKIEQDNRATYKIFVDVFDNESLTELQDPLLNYFRGNKYVSRRLAIEQEKLKERAKTIREELAMLDSLKKAITNSFKSSAGAGITSISNVSAGENEIEMGPVTLFTESKEQYEELQKIEQKIYLRPSFELIDGFAVFSRPDSPSLVKLGFYFGSVGLGVAYLIILLIGFNKYLNKVEVARKTA